MINKEKRTKLSKIAIKKAQKIATELKKKEIIQKDLNNKTLNKFPSIKEANIQTNIDCSSIIRCAKGKQSQAGGYKWEYQI